MMTWHIPAKTFLLGEYIAMLGGPAIVLTTTPCFELSVTNEAIQTVFHHASPAGRYHTTIKGNQALNVAWFDPYQGLGGLGASSAQFLGVFLDHIETHSLHWDEQTLLDAYWASAWSGNGSRPSGYDVLAQAQYGCVLIDRYHVQQKIQPWPFHDLAFILVHSGKKLATHEHLKQMDLPLAMPRLSQIAYTAMDAFVCANSGQLINAVNDYYHALIQMGLVAQHTQEQLALWLEDDAVFAAKGCGALGADVWLMLVSPDKLSILNHRLLDKGYRVLATTSSLYQGPAVII